METARVTNRGLALVPVLCLGLLGGCSYLPSNPFSREPEIALEDQSPQQIFLTGEALLADGRPRDAGEPPDRRTDDPARLVRPTDAGGLVLDGRVRAALLAPVRAERAERDNGVQLKARPAR